MNNYAVFGAVIHLQGIAHLLGGGRGQMNNYAVFGAVIQLKGTTGWRWGSDE